MRRRNGLWFTAGLNERVIVLLDLRQSLGGSVWNLQNFDVYIFIFVLKNQKATLKSSSKFHYKYFFQPPTPHGHPFHIMTCVASQRPETRLPRRGVLGRLSKINTASYDIIMKILGRDLKCVKMLQLADLKLRRQSRGEVLNKVRPKRHLPPKYALRQHLYLPTKQLTTRLLHRVVPFKYLSAQCRHEI